MKELYIFCVGQTEQGFCSRVLQPYFFPDHDGLIHTVRIAHSRRKGRVSRGGVNKYQIIKDDMLRSFSEHQRPQVLFTSFIDLYALPRDFPGYEQNTRNPDNPRPFVEAMEAALRRSRTTFLTPDSSPIFSFTNLRHSSLLILTRSELLTNTLSQL